MSGRLPEVRAHVDAWHRALKDDERAVIRAVRETREALLGERLELLPDEGVALRPLFLSKATIEGITRALVRGMRKLCDELAHRVDDAGRLPDDVRVPGTLFEKLETARAFADARVLTAMRPDVFLVDDMALLSEPNMGNGYLVSGAYPHLVDRVLRALPCADALASTMADMPRPLDGIVALIEQRLAERARTDGAPFVALFFHREEHEIILSWPTRVIRLIEHFAHVLASRGIESATVYETDLVVDEAGHARTADGKRVDLVFQVPIGTHFLHAPERFDAELSHLAGTHVGDAPFLMPLAHLAIDKGTMPRIGALDLWPVVLDDGTEVRPIDTVYPDEIDARTLRVEKDALLVKRSFEGKDTHIGIGTRDRLWNRVVDGILANGSRSASEYVVQPYVPLPETEMPILRGDHISIEPVGVELSLFILDEKHVGTFARYAPKRDGVVLSPPPDDMGFTLVSLV